MLRAHILTAASIKGALSGSFRVKNRALYQGSYKVCVVFLTHVSEMSVQPLEKKNYLLPVASKQQSPFEPHSV